VVAVLALVLAFYMWTAASSIPFSFSSANDDIYNQLTTAFLHLHTYLPIKVPAGLLHATNPYNPAQNDPYQAAEPLIHDLALYHGRFYSPWGPTPLTLFLPFRLTGLKMSESFAVVVFAFVGLVLAVALFHELAKRFLPATPGWLLVVATIGLALTNVEPFMLRRPAQYEVAISCGYCFEMAGLLLALHAVFAQRRRRWLLGLASLCLGLAIGARLSLIPGALVALIAAAYLIRSGKERRGILAVALGPIVVCGLMLAAYNAIRFGSASNFGEAYQLAGLDQMTMPADKLSYVPPGMFSYLVMPFRVALTFPHVFLVTTSLYPGPFPKGYSGSPGGWPAEPAGGLFTTMPITFLLVLVPSLWRRSGLGPSHAERPALLVAAGASALGLAIMFLLAYALWGTTQRYEVDYASMFLIAAFLVWSVLVQRCKPGTRARRAVAVLGIALTTFGAAVGTAVSFTGYDPLSTTHPGIFDTLEDITSPFATLATMVIGRPVLVRVVDALQTEVPESLGQFGEGGADAWVGVGEGPLTVVVDSPHAEHMDLTASTLLGVGAPTPAKLTLRVTSPGRAPLPVPVPVPGETVRLPIDLHWGLNRINVELSGPQGSSPDELYLGGLELRP
jgi:hypothetical protein